MIRELRQQRITIHRHRLQRGLVIKRSILLRSYHPIGAGVFRKKFEPRSQGVLDVISFAVVANMCDKFEVERRNPLVSAIAVIFY